MYSLWVMDDSSEGFYVGLGATRCFFLNLGKKVPVLHVPENQTSASISPKGANFFDVYLQSRKSRNKKYVAPCTVANYPHRRSSRILCCQKYFMKACFLSGDRGQTSACFASKRE